jgi:hypothetical protein
MEMHLKSSRRWPGGQAVCLRVLAGQAWITRRGELDDTVLAAGQCLALPAGGDLIIGPWHAAQPVQVQVSRADGAAQPLDLAPARDWRVRLAVAGAAAARRLAGGLLALARKAEAMASRAQGSICAGESMASSGALK